jgi:hypothetical protein
MTDLEKLREAIAPIAWMFELARGYDRQTGEYCNWGGAQVSFTKPNVPPGSIRSLTPLYSLAAIEAAGAKAVFREPTPGMLKTLGDLYNDNISDDEFRQYWYEWFDAAPSLTEPRKVERRSHERSG